MKTSIYTFAILAAALLAGCANSISKDDFKGSEPQLIRQFNEYADGKSSEVTFKDSSVIDLENVTVEEDSLRGTLTGNRYIGHNWVGQWEKEYSYPISDIKHVSLVRHSLSIIPGIALGITGGTIMGLIFFKGSGGASNSGSHTDTFSSGLIGAAFGFIPGAILGSLLGEDYVFTFNDTKPGVGDLNTAQKFGFRLGSHPGFSPEIIGDGYPARFNQINAQGRQGFLFSFYYNQPLSRLFSLNNEISFIFAGSDEKVTVKLPGEKTSYGNYMSNSVSRNFVEKTLMLELAPVLRLNIKRTMISPYLIAGPRFDFLQPAKTEKEEFYQELNNRYNDRNVNISGKYNKLLLGGTIGGGMSTGRLLPVELMLEARYNFDISSRFSLHYDTPLSREDFGVQGAQDISFFSREWIFSIGIALPRL